MAKEERVLSLEEAVKEGFDINKLGFKEEKIKLKNDKGEEIEIVKSLNDKKIGKYERVIHKIEDLKSGKKIMFDKVVYDEGPEDEFGNRTHISGATIVPYYIFKKDFYLGLIKQYRANPYNFETKSLGIDAWEFPMGFIKKDENFEEGAKRELKEEFLREVINIKKLGIVNANPARFVSSLLVYAAEVNPEELKGVKEDEGELITKRRFFSEKELEELVKNNEIINGISLSALAMFNAYKKELFEEYKNREEKSKLRIIQEMLYSLWPYSKW